MDSWNQTISHCVELYQIGFTFKQLKVLWHTIKEISAANHIDANDAVHKFFEDIKSEYDDKVGFELKIEELQDKVNKLSQEEKRLHRELFALPLVGPALLRLVQSGVKEQDIIDISELLKTETNFANLEEEGDRWLLIEEVRKYGSIKSTIKQLDKKADKLRDEVSSLEVQKQDLSAQNKVSFSRLVYSEQLIDFLSGSAYSLRNETISLLLLFLTIAANSMGLNNIQPKELQWKLQRHADLQEDNQESDLLLPLTKAAKGDKVALAEVKLAGIKAIDIILGQLDSSNSSSNGSYNDESRLKEKLTQAQVALIK